MRLVRRGRSVSLQTVLGSFSYYHPGRLFTGFSWDAQTASLFLAKNAIQRILILGLGGGTVARQCRALFPRAKIVGVEINPGVLRFAYDYFELASIGITSVNMPGELYLRKTRSTFDAIIDDMWLPYRESPKPIFVVPEWTDLIISRLRPGGVYAINLYSRTGDPYEFVTAVNRLSRGFPRLQEIRPGLGQTTVIAASVSLQSPRTVRLGLRNLAQPLIDGLSHVRFLSISNSKMEVLPCCE